MITLSDAQWAPAAVACVEAEHLISLMSPAGTERYNQGILRAVIISEAIRTAHRKYGARRLSGEEARWGFENLNLDHGRLKRLGVEELMAPIQLSCKNHGGSGRLRVQQWDGSRWQLETDWIEPSSELVSNLTSIMANQYAEVNKYSLRSCN